MNAIFCSPLRYTQGYAARESLGAEIGCGDLSQEMLSKVAIRATLPGEWMRNEPFPVDSKMVERAILAADNAGRTST